MENKHYLLDAQDERMESLRKERHEKDVKRLSESLA